MYSADSVVLEGVAHMVNGTKTKRSANFSLKKVSVRSTKKLKLTPRLKSVQRSVPAVVHRYLTQEEMRKFESANLIGTALLFLESLIFETCSAAKLYLAGNATILKLQKLGMSEEQAVNIMNHILTAAEKERKRNRLSGMF